MGDRTAVTYNADGKIIGLSSTYDVAPLYVVIFFEEARQEDSHFLNA